ISHLFSRRKALKTLSLAGLGFGFLKANASAESPTHDRTCKKKLKLEPYLNIKQGDVLTPNVISDNGQYEAELYGTDRGRVRILAANPLFDFQTNNVLYAKTPKNICYGEHWHKDYEIIYCVSGLYQIRIKTHPKNYNPEDIQFQEHLKTHVKRVKTTDEYKTFLIEEDGWIRIPGNTLHIVDSIKKSKMIAYLPSAKREDLTFDICQE
ncbi:MAG: hypothetical protein AAF203_05300, partial [Pseudomonadota bacterium]